MYSQWMDHQGISVDIPWMSIGNLWISMNDGEAGGTGPNFDIANDLWEVSHGQLRCLCCSERVNLLCLRLRLVGCGAQTAVLSLRPPARTTLLMRPCAMSGAAC